MPSITLTEARQHGYDVVRGAYTGTTDDRADRWYVDNRWSDVIDHTGAGYATRREALAEIAESLIYFAEETPPRPGPGVNPFRASPQTGLDSEEHTMPFTFRPNPATKAQLTELCTRFGSQQTVITMAIDRMYHQEAQRRTDNMTYHVDTDTDLYGDNCQDGQACAKAVAEHLTAYAAEHGLAVDIVVNSGQSNSTSDISDADRAIIQELDEISELEWLDWVPASAFV